MEEELNTGEQQAAPAIPGEPPEELCSKKVYDELYDRYLRLHAEFDNFRKRTAKEKREFQALATEKLLLELLPVIDHLELALKHARESGADDPLTEGVSLVLRQFLAVMEKHGVVPMEAMGKAFDPCYHEALMQMETARHEDNTVIEEHQRGYTISGRTLRPARVTVSRRKTPEQAAVDE